MTTLPQKLLTAITVSFFLLVYIILLVLVHTYFIIHDFDSVLIYSWVVALSLLLLYFLLGEPQDAEKRLNMMTEKADFTKITRKKKCPYCGGEMNRGDGEIYDWRCEHCDKEFVL